MWINKLFQILTCPRGLSFITSSALCSFFENSHNLLGHPSQSPFSCSAIITFQQGAEPEPQYRNMFLLAIMRVAHTPVGLMHNNKLSLCLYLHTAHIDFFSSIVALLHWFQSGKLQIKVLQLDANRYTELYIMVLKDYYTLFAPSRIGWWAHRSTRSKPFHRPQERKLALPDMQDSSGTLTHWDLIIKGSDHEDR